MVISAEVNVKLHAPSKWEQKDSWIAKTKTACVLLESAEDSLHGTQALSIGLRLP